MRGKKTEMLTASESGYQSYDKQGYAEIIICYIRRPNNADRFVDSMTV